MADEKVVIKIEVNADNRQIDQTTRKLRKMGAATALANTAGLASAKKQNKTFVKTLGDQQMVFKRHFDALDGMVKGFGKALTKSLGLIMKFSALEFGAMALALVGVHAAFAAGQIIMKAYRATMGLVAGGVAAAGVAIASVAAALREQQAAMFAYKTTAKTEFGSSMNQTRQVMRALQMDSSLATVGVENLNKAFAAVSKTSTFNAGSQRMLKGLMDFASAGQPIEQGIEKAGELIAVLQDTKKSYSDVQNAAKALGPEMEKAMAEAAKKGINTKQELIDAINSGQLATLGGVTGQFDAVSGTLISQLKGFFNIVRGQFADMGQPFLEPLKVAAQDIFRIFERGLMKTAGMTRSFGIENVISGVVRMAEKLEKFYVNTMFKYLHQADGIFQRMGDWWDRFTKGWNKVLDVLRPFIDGAKVLEKMLGKMWKPIAEEGAKNFKMVNSAIKENEGSFLKFGEQVGLLIASLMALGKKMKELYIDLLPFITDLLDGAKMIVEYFTSMLGVLQKIGKVFGGSEFGAFATLMGLRIAGRSMGATQGGFIATGMRAVTGRAPIATGGPGGIYGQSFQAAQNAGGMPSRAAQMATTFRTSSGQVIKAPSGPSGRPIIPAGQGMSSVRGAFQGRLMQGRQYGADYRAMRAAGMGRFASLAYAGRTMPQTKELGVFRTAGAAMRGIRERSPVLNKFNTSAGAMLGTSLGLNLASQFASKDAQGAFALGSMVASVNPLAGLGITGLGTALTSKTKAGGAMGGAAGGAAIGTMIAPGVGTAIGAFIGGVGGAIIGGLNASKEKVKKAKKTVSNVLDSTIFSAINDAANKMKTGTVGKSTFVSSLEEISNNNKMLASDIGKMRADFMANTPDYARGDGKGTQDENRAILDFIYKNQKKYGIEMTAAQLNELKDAPTTAVDKLSEAAYGSELLFENVSGRMEILQNVTGKTEQELVDLARTMGVNLADITVDLKTQMEQLGITMGKTADVIRGELMTAFVDNLSIFDKEIAKTEAPLIFDELVRSFRDRIDAGDMPTQPETLQFLKDAQAQLFAMFPEDPLKAINEFQRLFGANGALYSQAGGPLEGLGAFMTTNAGDALRAVGAANREDVTQKLIEKINTELLGQDKLINQTDLRNTFKNMTAEQFYEFAKFQLANPVTLQNGKFGMFGVTDKKGNRVSLDTVSSVKYDSDGNRIDQAIDPDTMSDAAYQGIVDGIAKYGDTIFRPNWIDDAPDWFKPDAMRNLFIEAGIIDGDTRTPRGDTTTSRLSQTMARHNQLNSMLTGSRTVTSSYRTTGLGSINSDHVTGRAYDLVGQNLGQYQRLVQQTGGFAEFHGVNDSRHLHVVPRADRMGDTTTATMAPPQTGKAMSSGGDNYYFTVSGGPNANAEDVANMVMAKIRAAERSRKERR